jgi:uncharacterized protein
VARPFVGEGVATVEEALAGARDIVAETISDHPEVRRETRERAWRFGTLKAEKIAKAEDPRGVFETYYAFEVPVGRLRPIKSWRSIAARRKKSCAWGSRCRSGTGARRSR